jgi:hypothetical protein
MGAHKMQGMNGFSFDFFREIPQNKGSISQPHEPGFHL